ncbi:hypothetical protein EVAR_64423_1 [Eumeta japonica]|uniref:Uncharacterized protein n=1 Tax=Eumeta variegata TaxID=151549 RepID=A0A4C1ZJC8_EUMVA|nr:hypothetical protein EVAR_64423_1 [Eumeta japonica]
MSEQAPRRLQRGRRTASDTSASGKRRGRPYQCTLCSPTLCTSVVAAVPSRLHFNKLKCGDISFGAVVYIRDLNKLRVVTKICRPVRGAARSAAHGACVRAHTHAGRPALAPVGIERDLDGIVAGGCSHSRETWISW